MSIHDIVDKIMSKKYYILDSSTLLEEYNDKTVLDYLIENHYYETCKFEIKKPNIYIYEIFINHKCYSYFHKMIIDGESLLEEIDGIPLIEWLLNNKVEFSIKKHLPDLLPYIFKYNREDLLKGFHISILDIDKTILGYTLKMNPEYIKMEYGIETVPIESDELLKLFNGYKNSTPNIMDDILIKKFEDTFNTGVFSDMDVIELCKRAFRYLLSSNRIEANYFINTIITIKKNNPNFHFESNLSTNSYFSSSSEYINIVPNKLDNYFTVIHELGHAIHFYSGLYREDPDYKDIKTKINNDPKILERVLYFCDKHYKKKSCNNLFYKEFNRKYPTINLSESEFYAVFYRDYIVSKYGSMEEYDKLLIEEFDPSEILDIGLECGYDIELLRNCFDTKLRREEYIKEYKNMELDEFRSLLERSTVEHQVSVLLDSLFDGKIYEGGMELFVDGRKRKISKMSGHSKEYHNIDDTRSFKEFMADYIKTKLMPNSEEVFSMLETILGFDIRNYFDDYYNYLLLKPGESGYGGNNERHR